MIYPYDYHESEGSFSYVFQEYNITISLSPAKYTTVDISDDLNIYMVNLIRNCPKNKRLDFGETVTGILYDFLDKDKTRGVAFYPSHKDNSDKSRVKLFSKWEELISAKDIVRFENKIVLVDDELDLIIYVHEEYPRQEDLLNEFNAISKSISGK